MEPSRIVIIIAKILGVEMNNNVELALLAGAAYESSRGPINKIPVPDGWSALNISGWPYGSQKNPQSNVAGRVYWQDSNTGFEATAYVKGNGDFC